MDESQWTWPPTTLGELTELLALVVVLAALCLRVLPATRRWAPRGHGGVAPTARTGRRARPPQPRVLVSPLPLG